MTSKTIPTISGYDVELTPLTEATDQFIIDHTPPNRWFDNPGVLYYEKWFLYDGMRYATAILGEQFTEGDEDVNTGIAWLRANFDYYYIEPANDYIIYFREESEEVDEDIA